MYLKRPDGEDIEMKGRSSPVYMCLWCAYICGDSDDSLF